MKDVALHQLRKTYHKGTILAVDNVSFEVEKGEIFGLIGPDGAGKSSLFRMLTTLLLPDSGRASVCGLDIVKDYKSIRKKIGYMPGRFSLYQDLSVEENLTFFATIFETTVEKNYDLIRDIYVQLEPFKTRRAGQLSGGMKQKLALCCALVHRPSVVFLDEPTTGIDTVSRKEFWTILKRLKHEGITVLVSTPYMDEASLCERIALIQNGKVMSVNTPQSIIQDYPHHLFAVKSDNMSSLLQTLRSYSFIESAFSFGEYHHITFKDNDVNLQTELMQKLKEEGMEAELKILEPSVEDCFIHLMLHS